MSAAVCGLTSIVYYTSPWILRVESIKEAASHNADTERKVMRLSEELKDMLREVKLRVKVSRHCETAMLTPI